MKATSITPIKRRVIVKLDGAATDAKTSGGIYIPPVVHQAIYQGQVVAVAKDCLDVKCGQVVILNRLCGDKLGRTPLPLDDENPTQPAEFVTIAEPDILCVLEPAA